jgi:hypothetical protein
VQSIDVCPALLKLPANSPPFESTANVNTEQAEYRKDDPQNGEREVDPEVYAAHGAA